MTQVTETAHLTQIGFSSQCSVALSAVESQVGGLRAWHSVITSVVRR